MGPFGRSGVSAGAAAAPTGFSCADATRESSRNFLSVGKRPEPAMPDTIAGRYWKLLIASSVSFGESGEGPLGLGPVPSPLAAIQTSRLRAVAPANTG